MVFAWSAPGSSVWNSGSCIELADMLGADVETVVPRNEADAEFGN